MLCLSREAGLESAVHEEAVALIYMYNADHVCNACL